MQIANALVWLDPNNSVPKYGLTAAEIVVLQAIYGVDRVTEIEITGETEASVNDIAHRAELMNRYRAKTDDGQNVVESLFPGRFPRLPVDFADLELPPDVYKAVRAAPAAAAKPVRRAPTRAAKAKAEADTGVTEINDDEDDEDVLN